MTTDWVHLRATRHGPRCDRVDHERQAKKHDEKTLLRQTYQDLPGPSIISQLLNVRVCIQKRDRSIACPGNDYLINPQPTRTSVQ
jgi:hypothetical protein